VPSVVTVHGPTAVVAAVGNGEATVLAVVDNVTGFGVLPATQHGAKLAFSVELPLAGSTSTRPEVMRPEGVEPPAFWSVAKRSIQLSYGRVLYDNNLRR
jgi:hypothetical protein